MNYNPSEKVDSGGRATAGRYRFKVDEANETVFRSGSEGVKLKLLVAAFKDKDVKVFDNLVFHPNALWKVEQFMQSIGLDFNDTSIQAHDLVGLTGEAEFVVGENKYLEVAEYLPAKAGNVAAKPKTNGRPTVAPTDDVPF